VIETDSAKLQMPPVDRKARPCHDLRHAGWRADRSGSTAAVPASAKARRGSSARTDDAPNYKGAPEGKWGGAIYFKSGSEAPTHSITGAQIRDLFGISDDNLVFLAPHDYEAEADSYEVEVTADDGAHTILRSSGAGLTIETLRLWLP
jgi:hypothetical protein